MRSITVCCSAAIFLVRTSNAFTSPSSITSLSRVNYYGSSQQQYKQQVVADRSPILFANHNNEDELLPSLQLITKQSQPKNLEKKSSSVRQRIKAFGQLAIERTNTLKAAGLHDEENGVIPMQAGFKTNVGLLVGAFLFKWYRARFINKIPVWDRQPQWNMVVTSPEQEKELHAYSCKNCGATIFIARHREWFFKGGNTECTNCGAKGTDNFEDIRGEVIDSIDDDYFDYESPLDFVSAAERRKLIKQAGGDEEKAKQIAIDNVMKNDKEQMKVLEEEASASGDDTSESSGSDDAPAKKTKKKKAPKSDDDDIFDELDMDL